LNLTDLEKRRLAIALGTLPDADDFAERIEALKEVAFEELVDWILERRRFDSVSAIDRARVLQVFGVIRKEAPTVETLANELGISESRAVSLLSRLRYGDARTVRYLTMTAAVHDLATQLEHATEHSERKHVWVKAETGRVVDEANTAIMLDQTGRAPGGKFEGAELAERTEAKRTGQLWSASPKMWELIKTWIAERADEFRPADGTNS
jgi:hypothetical protein